MKKRAIGIMICLLVLAAGIAFAQAEGPSEPPASEPAPAAPDPEYKNFTTGQRLGTWALNEFVFPGVGSFIMMKDTTGGTIQIVVGGVGDVLVTTYGIILLAAYVKVFKNFKDDFDNHHDDYSDDSPEIDFNPIWDAARNYLGLVIAGGVLATANTVFNIIRSATYDRPPPKVGSLADINAWSIAVVPGTNGGERVQLAYTLRY